MSQKTKFYVVLGPKGLNRFVVPKIESQRPNANVFAYLEFNGFSAAKKYAIDCALENTEHFRNEMRELRALTKADFHNR